MNTNALLKVRRARRAGIVSPLVTWRACRKAGLPYSVGCALLAQESYGGKNVWGSDPTWMVGYGEVTECNYGVYRKHRPRFGSQGVGPCQLTYYSIQDRADVVGGCWKPLPNMVTGFTLLASHYTFTKDWRESCRRYNGTGPAAEAYADRMVTRIAEWRTVLGED